MLKTTIHFLTEFPNKILLSVLFGVIFAAYLIFQTDFLAQLSRDAFVAVLTIVGARALNQPIERFDELNIENLENKEENLENKENL